MSILFIIKLLIRTNNKNSYTQTLKLNMEDIIYIKNIFPSLFLKKIVKVNNILNILKLVKFCIKIVTKRLLRKQIIIFINTTQILLLTLLDQRIIKL